jgi:hypothetical protein
VNEEALAHWGAVAAKEREKSVVIDCLYNKCHKMSKIQPSLKN